MSPTVPHTAVQICPDTATCPRCELVHGDAVALHVGQLGPVALFAPGEIVAYVLHAARPSRLFVFRTLGSSPHLAPTVLPGVYPHVHLLLALDSLRVIRRGRRFFALLKRRATPPSRLPDAFYLRLDRTLRARAPLPRLAATLLDAGASA
jgi:hypothetical protein